MDTVYRRGSSEQLGRDGINVLQNATPPNVSVLEIDTSMNVDLHISWRCIEEPLCIVRQCVCTLPFYPRPDDIGLARAMGHLY